MFTRDSGRIALLAGELRRVAVPTNSGRPHRIFRCATCQTAIWSEYGGIETLRFVRVGTLDDPAAIPPNAHIYVRSKLPWDRYERLAAGQTRATLRYQRRRSRFAVT